MLAKEKSDDQEIKPGYKLPANLLIYTMSKLREMSWVPIFLSKDQKIGIKIMWSLFIGTCSISLY